MPHTPAQPAIVSSAVVRHPAVQLALLHLFERYTREMAALHYRCTSAHHGHGETGANFCEGGIESALWKDGVIGSEGVMLNLTLRFEYTEAAVQSITMRLTASPLLPDGSSSDAQMATSTMPIGKTGERPRSSAPGFLLSLALNGLSNKRSNNQDEHFREWLVPALREWGRLQPA